MFSIFTIFFCIKLIQNWENCKKHTSIRIWAVQHLSAWQNVQQKPSGCCWYFLARKKRLFLYNKFCSIFFLMKLICSIWFLFRRFKKFRIQKFNKYGFDCEMLLLNSFWVSFYVTLLSQVFNWIFGDLSF